MELVIKNEDEFSDRLNNIYTQGHPEQHQYLKTGEFAEKYEPSQAEKDNVVAELEKAGFEITQRLGRYIHLGGCVSDIAKFFHTEMNEYTGYKETSFIASPYDVFVPKNLGIVGVKNLDTKPRTIGRLKSTRTDATAQAIVTSSNTSYPPLPNTLQFLRSMYTIPTPPLGYEQTQFAIMWRTV